MKLERTKRESVKSRGFEQKNDESKATENNTRNKQMKNNRRVFRDLPNKTVCFNEINDVLTPSNTKVACGRT